MSPCGADIDYFTSSRPINLNPLLLHILGVRFQMQLLVDPQARKCSTHVHRKPAGQVLRVNPVIPQRSSTVKQSVAGAVALMLAAGLKKQPSRCNVFDDTAKPTPEELRTQAWALLDSESEDSDADEAAAAEALALLRQVVELEEQRYGAQHPCVARALSELAEALAMQSRYSEAEECLRRALAIDELGVSQQHQQQQQQQQQQCQLPNCAGQELLLSEEQQHAIIAADLNNLALVAGEQVCLAIASNCNTLCHI
jgi:tetratricopeptide (TPR) repeat protein